MLKLCFVYFYDGLELCWWHTMVSTALWMKGDMVCVCLRGTEEWWSTEASALSFSSFSHLHFQHLFLCLTLASSAIDHSNRPPPTRPRFHTGIPWQQLSHLLEELLGWWCKHTESVGNFSECSDNGGWGVWGKLPSALSVAQLFIHLSSCLLSFLVLSRSWNKIITPVGPDADCLLRLWGFHCAVIQEHQLQLINFFPSTLQGSSLLTS